LAYNPNQRLSATQVYQQLAGSVALDDPMPDTEETRI
jgi:hypothetical protein